MKKIIIKIWEYFTTVVYKIKREYRYRKKLREMRKRDPFIYK